MFSTQFVDTNDIHQRNNHHKINQVWDTRKPIGNILCGKNRQDESPEGTVNEWLYC